MAFLDERGLRAVASAVRRDHQQLDDKATAALKAAKGSVKSVTVTDGVLSVTSSAGTTTDTLIPFDQTYLGDCNDWIKNGFTKTGQNHGRTTKNLPPECRDSAIWGVLFGISENISNGTCTQLYFPIDGRMKGRLFIRSAARRNWTPWALIPEISDVQAVETRVQSLEREAAALRQELHDIVYGFDRGNGFDRAVWDARKT